MICPLVCKAMACLDYSIKFLTVFLVCDPYLICDWTLDFKRGSNVNVESNLKNFPKYPKSTSTCVFVLIF